VVYILDRKTVQPILVVLEKKCRSRGPHTFGRLIRFRMASPFVCSMCDKSVCVEVMAPREAGEGRLLIFNAVHLKQYTAFRSNALVGTDWPPSSYAETGSMYSSPKKLGAWKASLPSKPWAERSGTSSRSMVSSTQGSPGRSHSARSWR